MAYSHYVKPTRIKLLNNRVPKPRKDTLRIARIECRVLELIAEGHRDRTAIAEQVGVSIAWFNRLAKRMVEDGLIEIIDSQLFLTEA